MAGQAKTLHSGAWQSTGSPSSKGNFSVAVKKGMACKAMRTEEEEDTLKTMSDWIAPYCPDFVVMTVLDRSNLLFSRTSSPRTFGGLEMEHCERI